MFPFVDESGRWHIERNRFYGVDASFVAYHSIGSRASGEMGTHQPVSVRECNFQSTAHSPHGSEGRNSPPVVDRWRELN